MNYVRLFERQQRSKHSNLFGKHDQFPQTNMVGGVIRTVSQPPRKKPLASKSSKVSREVSNYSSKVAYPISYATAQPSEPPPSICVLDGKNATPCTSTAVNESFGDCRRTTNIVNMMFKLSYGNRRRNSKHHRAATEANEQSFILIKKDRMGQKSKLQLSVVEAIKQTAIAVPENRNAMPICTVESKLVGYHPAKQYLRAERQRAIENKLRAPLKIESVEPTNNPVLSINRCEDLQQQQTERKQEQMISRKLTSPMKNATVQDLLCHLTEDKRMLATSLNNHPTNNNDYILKRRQTNKKDHFVFGMDSRTVCQSTAVDYADKIGQYRDFLWKVNFSNGLLVEPLLDYQYKVYVGRGNNCQLIRGLLKRRFWWTFVDKLTDDVNFVWTQLKVPEFYDRQQQNYESQPQAKRSLTKSQSATHCSLGFLETSTNNFSSDSQPVTSPKKTLPALEVKPDAHCNLFSETDLAEWRQHYSRNKEIEDRLEEKVYVKRTPLLRGKGALKLQQPIQLRVQNHFAFNYFIGNKKAMFYCLRKYYDVTGQDVFDFLPLTFHISRGTDDPEYRRFLHHYQELRKTRRQTKSQNVWIVKPGEFTNRGHGITVCETLEDVIIRLKGRQKNANGKLRTFIVQKYLQRPFLYHRRKFDIRHYMLMTCINGKFKGYWYAQGYIRTTSFEYSVKNCRDNLVHLTNDAVQKYCPEYGRYEKGNKLSYADFQKYLDAFHRPRRLNFQQMVLPRMRCIATDAVKSCYHLLDPGRRPHNFEVFGLDFMIDEDFRPWLIEINTNPCLELACPLLTRIIPSMLENAFKLTIDPLFQPPLDWPANKKYQLGENPLDNNRFSLIFDETIDGPQLQELYRNVERIDKNMGDIEEEDAEYQDDGGEWTEEQLPPA